MESVVNDQYRYILFYGAKVACTSLRNLYLAIHQTELSQAQLAELNEYHNLNEVCAFDPDKDYSDYFKFYISRNPYSRVVSAFLDQYVLVRHESVKAMMQAYPPVGGEPRTLLAFLQYLKDVPDAFRDSHFQSQTHFGHKGILSKKPWLRRLPPNHIALDYTGDVGDFNHHLAKVYRRVFKRHAKKREIALEEIRRIPRMNNMLYSDKSWPDAAKLTTDYLGKLPFLPKPQDFFTSPETRELVQEIYANDFVLFDYDPNSVPKKKASPESFLVPEGFDWQTYALLNPDVAFEIPNTERALTHHYLLHGRHEQKKRFYTLRSPSNFDWQAYLELNTDLTVAGIDNERDALIHYLTFGYHENRAIVRPE